MFESWSPWAWVTAAWAELILVYAGYLVYLQRRAKRLEEQEDALSNG